MKRKTIILSFITLATLIACSKSNDTIEDKVTPVKENWYTTKTINSNTVIIEEPKSSQRNVSYLIKGDTKALMIDTGSGENSGYNNTKVDYLLKELTNLPITLLLSHFHFDHNQNIGEFNNVAFPDLPFLRQKATNNIYHFSAEELFSGSLPESVTINEWMSMATDIDLGNRTIQLINIQGHTQESIAIIDKTNKFAFLGDFLYNGTLFMFDKNDVDAYKNSVDNLISLLDNQYLLFGAHGTPEINFSKLKDLQDLLICIQNKTCKAEEQFVWGKNTHLYELNGMKIRVFLK